jgi:spermidine dehydrogenase
MGGYEFTRSPDTPTVVHGSFIPAAPGLGLSAREQHVAGRARIYDMRYEDFERLIVRQLDGALGSGGFDVERDLAAITVNRWPHGYAYEYNDFFDPPDYGPQKGPHIRARERLGRISIANSDAAAFAYVDGAFDSAHRAVTEVLGEKKPA